MKSSGFPVRPSPFPMIPSRFPVVRRASRRNQRPSRFSNAVPGFSVRLPGLADALPAKTARLPGRPSRFPHAPSAFPARPMAFPIDPLRSLYRPPRFPQARFGFPDRRISVPDRLVLGNCRFARTFDDAVQSRRLNSRIAPRHQAASDSPGRCQVCWCSQTITRWSAMTSIRSAAVNLSGPSANNFSPKHLNLFAAARQVWTIARHIPGSICFSRSSETWMALT